MLSGSPLNKDWKQKNSEAEQKQKVQKILGKGEAKKLVQRSCDSSQCQWIDRWLKNFVQSRSLPPQMAGTEAYSSIIKFMGESEAEKVFESLRLDFNSIYPRAQ